MTEHDCLENFMRLNTYTHVVGTPFDTFIEYNGFKEDSFICIYDLSTNGTCGRDGTVPQVRGGQGQLDVIFSGPTAETITVLIYMEIPSTLTIDKNRRITKGYKN